MYEHILVRYGELALKGKNQKEFIKTLVRNLRKEIKNQVGPAPEVVAEQGRLIIHLNQTKAEEVYKVLDHTFGLSSYSPVKTAPLNEEAIIQAALEEMKLWAKEGLKFRVSVKRANKRFMTPSMQMQVKIAERLLDEIEDLEPNLTDYDLNLQVDIRFDNAYIYVKRFKGLGGLPLGTGGRAMLLLSGGIDSPVAGYSIMRRGVVIEAIHFHSYPYTSKEAEEKVLKLAEEVAKYAGYINVHLVPFTEIQEAIQMSAHENYRITIMRRIMLRIAERIAHRRHAKALITGDNLGQVASQTMESIFTINEVTTMPIYRPLISFDKLDIMRIAEEIGTYETSILPYADCCTVFVPKEPKTKPRVDIAQKDESRMDLELLIEGAISTTTSYTCYGDGRARVKKRLLDEVLEDGQ